MSLQNAVAEHHFRMPFQNAISEYCSNAVVIKRIEYERERGWRAKHNKSMNNDEARDLS